MHFMVEQTDLPFLVRQDTNLFLRESDVKEGGAQRCVLPLRSRRPMQVVDVHPLDSRSWTISRSRASTASSPIRTWAGVEVKVTPGLQPASRRSFWLTTLPRRLASKITGTPPVADSRAGTSSSEGEGGERHHPDELLEVLPRHGDGARHDPRFRHGGTDSARRAPASPRFPTLSIAGPDALADGRAASLSPEARTRSPWD